MKRNQLSWCGQLLAAQFLMYMWVFALPANLNAQEILCPPEVSDLPCDVDPSPPTTGEPQLINLCANPMLLFADEIIPGGCPNSYTITRNWTVTDDCMNNLGCTQIIVVVDPFPPVITCPPDITIGCDIPPTPDITGFATAEDACDPDVVITYSDEVIPSGCPHNYTIIRTWMATDACGNSSSCEQIITLIDEVAPLVFCPPNITLECDKPFNPGAVGFATAEDNCSVEIELMYWDNFASTTLLERTWIAVDECGNASECVQLITLTVADCPLKVVPVRFCVFGKGDMTANNKRFQKKNLLDGLRIKNTLWKQCNVQFKPNKDAIDEIEDKELAPSGEKGDVVWDDKLTEFNNVMKQCNEAAGKDALEKLTEIFIRDFVDTIGKSKGFNGGAYQTTSCTKKAITSKPMMVDPSYESADPDRFGTTIAHENGHALSLEDLKQLKDTSNVMYYKARKGKNKFTDDQCKRARVEAQKISGTTDKDADGAPTTRAAPRTRIITDDLSPGIPQTWSDVMEHAVTYLSDEQLLSLITIAQASDDVSGSPYLYRFMVDADNDLGTGGDVGLLFGYPDTFPGADFYAELLVTFDPEPKITGQNAFAIFSSEIIMPITDFEADASLYSISFTGPDGSSEVTGSVILDLDVSENLLPHALVEGYRSATSAEKVGDMDTFDATEDASGSITPFEEPTLILLDPLSGSSGSVVSITGEAFTPECEVEISFDTLIIGSVMTDMNGAFSTQFTIPANPGGDGLYSIMAVDTALAGDVMLFNVVTGTSEVERDNQLLGPNFPNPFTVSTTIPYELPTSAQVRITITNQLGQEVAVLQDGNMPSGRHQVQWAPGPGVSGGVYTCQLRAGNRSETMKVIYLKK